MVVWRPAAMKSPEDRPRSTIRRIVVWQASPVAVSRHGMRGQPAGYGPAVVRRVTLVGIVAVAAAVLLALGAATLIGSRTSHLSMMGHVAAEASETAGPVGDRDGEHHPGVGVHLAGACAAILAAALVVLRSVGGFRAVADAGAKRTRPLRQRPMGDVVPAAGIGPPRVALCVELR